MITTQPSLRLPPAPLALQFPPQPLLQQGADQDETVDIDEGEGGIALGNIPALAQFQPNPPALVNFEPPPFRAAPVSLLIALASDLAPNSTFRRFSLMSQLRRRSEPFFGILKGLRSLGMGRMKTTFMRRKYACI